MKLKYLYFPCILIQNDFTNAKDDSEYPAILQTDSDVGFDGSSWEYYKINDLKGLQSLFRVTKLFVYISHSPKSHLQKHNILIYIYLFPLFIICRSI